MKKHINPLRAYRVQNDLSFSEFGSLFGVNKSTVFRWEAVRVPADRVIEVERTTGMSRRILRPDLYPEEPNWAA